MLEELGLDGVPFALMTMHRPSNVDMPEQLAMVVEVMERTAELCRLVFPMHPRTRKRLHDVEMWDRVKTIERLDVLEPLGYLEFLHLMEHARVLLTDSGGIQEESTFLGVPCLTVRENTERPVTVTSGTNELLPLDPDRIRARVAHFTNGGTTGGEVPPLWDGRAAERIVSVLAGA